MKIPLIALPHRINVIPLKGSGAYGPIYDDQNVLKNVPCYIEPLTQLIQDVSGSDVTQRAEIMFHPNYTIKEGDKIVWSLMSKEYTIREIEPIMAMGIHHFEGILM